VRRLVVLFALLLAAPAEAATVKSVTAGWAHTCALRSDLRVSCWGRGYSGVPVRVPGLARITRLDADGDATCAVRRGGRVLCWRGSRARVVEGITDAREVAVGAYFRCVLRAGGGVLCWGDNDAGALGDGTTSDAAAPVAVTGVAGAVRLAAGGERACAIDGAGAVWCWGAGQPFAAVVPGVTGATEVAVADDFACALHAGGRVACWGAVAETTWRTHGGGPLPTWQAGPVPADVPGVADAVALAAGGGAACAVRRGGGVACWGDNAYGTLGDGTRLPALGAVRVESLTGAREVAVGAAHACAVRARGPAVCWGRGDEGVLGDGRRTARNAPVTVKGLG
jgi:alpha-tubulin suppressor-like RCC1 family protein